MKILWELSDLKIRMENQLVIWLESLHKLDHQLKLDPHLQLEHMSGWLFWIAINDKEKTT